MVARQLGRILIDEFDWPEEAIDRAAELQRESGGRTSIGHFLREGEGPVSACQDVALALLLQREEADSQAAAAFDEVEHQELGEQLRFEHSAIGRKIRFYMGVMTVLILYVAYPLSYAVGKPAAFDEKAWVGVFLIYSVVGIFLTVFVMIQGDDLIKSYGEYLKRRVRMGKSRSQIRARAVSKGATPTLMPRRAARRALHSPEEPMERPDPEFTGLQRHLPLYYSGLSLINLALLTFFASSLIHQGLTFDATSLQSGICLVGLAAPIWIHFLSALCERYHKYLGEATDLSLETPFPRRSTRDFRDQGKYRFLEGLATIGIYSAWAGIALLGVLHFKESHSSASTAPSNPWLYPLVVIGLCAFVYAIRVATSRERFRLLAIHAKPTLANN